MKARISYLGGHWWRVGYRSNIYVYRGFRMACMAAQLFSEIK